MISMLHRRLGTVPAALKIASDYCATTNPLVQKAYNLLSGFKLPLQITRYTL